jgi:hypothetical protein
MDFSLDVNPYFQILHNMIRQSDYDEESEQQAASINWVRENANTFRRVCARAEFGVIHVLFTYWDKHKTVPSLLVLNELLRGTQQNQTLLDIMTEYEKRRADLVQIPHLDLLVFLDQRKADYEKLKMGQILGTMVQITSGSIPDPDPKLKGKSWTGPRDAQKYFHEQMQKGIFLDDVQANGGVLADIIGGMEVEYDQAESDSKNNNLYIPTGIGPIDSHLGGLRRKELNGILGFVAQKKSTVLRTIGYEAALRGFRVLHIPLESDCKEEQNFYAIQHAEAFFKSGISKKRLDRAVLSEEEKAQLFRKVIPDFQASIGKNIIVYTPGATRAWADVRSIIERENDKEPIDLIMLDYLTLLSTPGNRDDIADKMAIVQDAKQLALNGNNGKGFCILTPVQGNRKGFEEAAERGGEWYTTGIAKYSELDKSLDNLFYVYFDDEMNSHNQMKMGSCKTRRDSNIPALFVSVNAVSGMVEKSNDLEGSGTVTAAKPDNKPTTLSPEIDDMRQYY